MRCPEIYITETNHEVILRNPTSKPTSKPTANNPQTTRKRPFRNPATSQRKNAILRFHLCDQGLQT